MVSLQIPAIFFDRDGVLNKDFGYVYKSEDFKWIPGAMETIKHLKDMGYAIFVITNQSGVARGYFTEEDIKDLHEWINEELFEKYQVKIDGFYYCPHHPTVGQSPYQTKCECRKPKPGLIIRALKDFHIDKSKSYFIGDKDTDIEAASDVGIRGYIFQSENLLNFMHQVKIL